MEVVFFRVAENHEEDKGMPDSCEPASMSANIMRSTE
jgi:hypothetical protein